MWQSGVWVAVLCVAVLTQGNELLGNDNATQHNANVPSELQPGANASEGVSISAQTTLSTSTIATSQLTGSVIDTDKDKNATTTPPTTTTTTAATTTTTTTAATTTAPSTTASTTRSTTSVTSPPTTVPTTTPLPPPATGHYEVANGNTTCIMAEMAVQIMIQHENKTWSVDMPSNATSNQSFCNNSAHDLILSWQNDLVVYDLTIQFSKNNSIDKYMVSNMTLTVPYQNETLKLVNEECEFTTPIRKSYRCAKEQEVKLTDKSNSTYAVLKMSHVQFQAFDFKENDKFGAVQDCAGSSPDIVPIAVGCALVGLVAIVLIAYLVGRRRSQARGYLSM